MKYLLSFVLLIVLMPIAAHAQSKPLFPFTTAEKSQTTPQEEVTEDTLDLIELKDKPLAERRQIVAAQLDSILVRLNVLYDKTKVATDRLTQNGIVTDASQSALADAALSLANARITVDALLAAANNPATLGAQTLMIGNSSFKDTVLSAEEELRTGRTSIITALTALKAAISTAASTE